MGNYSFVDVLLLLGIAQGFFLSVTLPIVHQKNIAANKILSLQLTLACFTLLTRIIVFKAEELWVIQRISVLETFIFVFGPLGYIYLKRLLEKGQEKFSLPLYHYIPALLYLCYLLYINIFSSQEFGERLASGYFANAFFIAELSALLFNLYYWYLSLVFFLKVLRGEKEQLSFSQPAISFVGMMLLIISVILLGWIVSFCSTYFFQTSLPIVNYNSVWIAIPILIYVIGYFALKQPNIFRIEVAKDSIKNPSKSRMDEESIQILQRKLEKLMDKEQVYLNNELTLFELAKQLNTSTNKLSWLLNTVYKSSFYDFINEYRVNAFLAKLERNEHKAKTLFSLSMEVGFNSKSTFNKAFKASLNETPSSYIKRLAC